MYIRCGIYEYNMTSTHIIDTSGHLHDFCLPKRQKFQCHAIYIYIQVENQLVLVPVWEVGESGVYVR